MYMRFGAASLALTTGVLLGAAILPQPVLAAPIAVAAAAATSAAADLVLVTWIARKDPREIVRITAKTALYLSSDRDRAIAQFLSAGYQSAIKRATATRARNLDFAKRILATTSRLAAPEVYAAAEAAVNGTDVEQAWFVRTGYTAAKERDRLAREADGAQKAALLETDRLFVVMLRDKDPGEQVKASAAWALRTGATDADIVDFFAHGWLNGASLDLEVHRTRLADADVAWDKAIDALIMTAEDAEAAAVATADEAKRAQAALAWQVVKEKTDTARTTWSEAETAARAQAANWQEVAAAALAAKGPNWEPVIAPATANQAEWAEEITIATDRTDYWSGLYTKALAGELRMTTTTTTTTTS
jgi:hypothetical protein